MEFVKIVHDSYNTLMDTNWEDELLSEDFMVFYCPQCGRRVKLMKDVLVNDMLSGKQVWISSTQSVAARRRDLIEAGILIK